MEWSNISFQKEIVTRKDKTEISSEGFIHTRKLEFAFKRSIKETHKFFGRMASDSNRFRNETCSRNLNTDDSLQQDRQHNLQARIRSEDFNMDYVNADGKTEVAVGTGGSNGMTKTTDLSVHFTENLDSSISDFGSSSNNIENNNEVDHTCINSKDANDISENRDTCVKVCEIEVIPETSLERVSAEKKNYDMGENLAETKRNIKSNEHDLCFANFSANGKCLLNCKYTEGVFSKPDIHKPLGFSSDAKADENSGNVKIAKTRIKHYKNENISLAKIESINNNSKGYCYYPPYLKTETNESPGDTTSKSVTDLITYFETLITSVKHSCVKLPDKKTFKTTSFAEEDWKNKCFIQDVGYNPNSSLSTPAISKNNIRSQNSAETTADVIQPFVNTDIPRQCIKSPTTEYGIRTCRIGKGDCFEKNETGGDAEKIKEHVFLFNDCVTNDMKHSKVLRSRRYRPRFPKNVNKPQPLAELQDAGKLDKSPSIFRMTKNEAIFYDNKTNETNTIPTVAVANSKQNLIARPRQAENNRFPKKKFQTSENSSHIECIIGCLLAMLIIGIICQALFKFWYQRI